MTNDVRVILRDIVIGTVTWLEDSEIGIFLMNRRGEWRLSPAFDISYAWNPSGEWTSRHQMSVNGKRDGFEHEDLLALAKTADIKKTRAEQMINRVIETVRLWPDFAEESGVDGTRIKKIQAAQRTNL